MRIGREKRNWLLGVAVALAAAGVPASSWAQQRVGNDGRALDANNRLGAGGHNTGGQRVPIGVSGNQIVTGNVTAGREFRGFVPYTDPFAFRGRVAGQGSDNFAKNSSGIPTGGISNFNATTIKPFYGDARTVEVPPGFTQQPNSLGFVPAPIAQRQAGDFRMGQAFPVGTQQVSLPQPGQLVLPGPVDPNTQAATVITASPLYGVRQWSTENQTDMGFLQGLNEAGRLRLDQATIDRMQRELEEAAKAEADADPNRVPADRINALEAPQNVAMGKEIPNESLLSEQALSNQLATNAGTRQRLLATPAQQSTQYAELQRRLKQYEAQFPGKENQDAAREYAEALRDKEQRDKQAKGSSLNQPGAPQAPGATPPTGTPGAAQTQPPARPDPMALPGAVKPDDSQAQPRSPIPGSVTPSDRPAPLMVSSLATGVQANSLKDFLTQAETLMKQGKYYSALDQYDSAELVAPNNNMILLGRANAELGASYYVRADTHLREAFGKDPALLMAQYDLKGMIGSERLEFLVKDLKEIANTEKNEPRPVFLLAYIMYNTGNERLAASYLDLAEKRAGKSDDFYQLLRQHWVLPSGGEAPAELNK